MISRSVISCGVQSSFVTRHSPVTGGGSGEYKGYGGLAVGNVGNASVGVLDEETEVEGGLDKEVIARYIKSQLGQIRYCYERQLSANPELYGKVLVKFTIGGRQRCQWRENYHCG